MSGMFTLNSYFTYHILKIRGRENKKYGIQIQLNIPVRRVVSILLRRIPITKDNIQIKWRKKNNSRAR